MRTILHFLLLLSALGPGCVFGGQEGEELDGSTSVLDGDDDDAPPLGGGDDDDGAVDTETTSTDTGARTTDPTDTDPPGEATGDTGDTGTTTTGTEAATD